MMVTMDWGSKVLTASEYAGRYWSAPRIPWARKPNGHGIIAIGDPRRGYWYGRSRQRGDSALVLQQLYYGAPSGSLRHFGTQSIASRLRSGSISSFGASSDRRHPGFVCGRTGARVHALQRRPLGPSLRIFIRAAARRATRSGTIRSSAVYMNRSLRNGMQRSHGKQASGHRRRC